MLSRASAAAVAAAEALLYHGRQPFLHVLAL